MTASEFRSHIPDFPLPLRALESVTGLGKLFDLYAELRTQDASRPILERLVEHLHVTSKVTDRDLAQIPKKGPTVVVANHPFGMLEAAVLGALLNRVRPDVRFLANGILAHIPELRDVVIAVDPMGGRGAALSNQQGLRKALEHLLAGGLLVVFPAGEVSHFQLRNGTVTDPAWSASIARLIAFAARSGTYAATVPVYIEGSNSFAFHAAGLLHPRLRTALLARELLNKRHSVVRLHIGGAIDAEKLLSIPTNEARIEYLRWRTYLLGQRRAFKADTKKALARRESAEAVPIAAAADPKNMEAEVANLTPLAASGEQAVYLGQAGEIPQVLQEIGRLREITFRAAGEGTGKPIDLDRFDEHYLHLFVWNHAKSELVGAYRLSSTVWGTDHLYTATLFGYSNEFLKRLGPALELGRSFVRVEYQRSFSPLLLLWKGIGQYVARNPRYKVLFGPVSISNRYQPLSREIMVSFLERRASLMGWAASAWARNPFHRRSEIPLAPEQDFDVEDLSALVSDLEPERAGVPVLLRQYLRLGGKLLGFNVDPQFNNALDGLILVDLTKTDAKLLERYLGKAEAARFNEFQEVASKGKYAA